MTDAAISPELQSWAERAGYSKSTDDSGAEILYSAGGEIRYYLRCHPEGWLLSMASRGGSERFVLRAPGFDALERHLFGVFGAVVRDDLGLPFLFKPYAPSDVADGFSLSGMSDDGYRTLSDNRGERVADARDDTRSLLILVPLSHYLRLSLSDLRQSFLSDTGAPLMSGNDYAR